MNEIEKRRSRALAEAGCTRCDDVEGAVEVATQVELTDDIVKAAFDDGRTSFVGRKRIIRAALTAAGFEVIE